VEGVPADAYAHLASRYGYAARDVLALAAERGELAQPIVEGAPDVLAEALQAARREQARSVGDVLLRRTRLGLLAARQVADRDAAVARRVAGAMALEHGWDDKRCEHEAQRFLEEAAAEGIVVGA
jgi:glycerol-3-phosphate dehydrogenase